MRRVRRSGTGAELSVRCVARDLGLRMRRNRTDLPGSPDLSSARLRLAVFVHGCFWHQHPGCARAIVPRTNRTFWSAKFASNERRDRDAGASLRRKGYTVVVIWECELRDVDRVAAKLRRAVKRCEAKRPLAPSRNES